MVDTDDLIKIWDEGDLHLGIITKDEKKFPNALISYTIIKHIMSNNGYLKERSVAMSSSNNIVKNYGKMTKEQHFEKYPEEWI